MNTKKILIVLGTRPEVIKLLPVIERIEKSDKLQAVVCISGQHRKLVDDVLLKNKITPDYDLDIMETNQSLNSITTKMISGLDKIINEVQFDCCLVHGDTTTAMAAALCCFNRNIPVGHVEAG